MKKITLIIALFLTGILSAQMTSKEELDIMNDSVYTFPSSQYSLADLIRQSAVGKSAEFILSQKDTSGDELADSYRSKIARIARLLAERPGRVTGELERQFVAYIGRTFTYAQVTGATEAQWVNTVDANIMGVLEIVAGVTPQEKTAYDAL